MNIGSQQGTHAGRDVMAYFCPWLRIGELAGLDFFGRDVTPTSCEEGKPFICNAQCDGNRNAVVLAENITATSAMPVSSQ